MQWKKLSYCQPHNAETDQRVLRLGDTVPGSQYDGPLLKEGFNPNRDRFVSTEVAVDRDYPNIQTDASSPGNVHIPDQKLWKSRKNLDPRLMRPQQREHRRIETGLCPDRTGDR